MTNGPSLMLASLCSSCSCDHGSDAGNPDPEAVRLVYADRELAADQLAGIMRE